jgi:hypothetical protein
MELVGWWGKRFGGLESAFTCAQKTRLMSDLLAIVGGQGDDEQLLAEIARRRPDRVTVLVEDGDADLGLEGSASGGAVRDRLALLLRAIEQRTGAVVVGLAGSRSQLRGWRFDLVVGGGEPLAI